jgi:hypothetical protein
MLSIIRLTMGTRPQPSAPANGAANPTIGLVADHTTSHNTGTALSRRGQAPYAVRNPLITSIETSACRCLDLDGSETIFAAADTLSHGIGEQIANPFKVVTK